MEHDRPFFHNLCSKLRGVHFSFSFGSRGHRSARKGPYALRPVSQQSPQGCSRNSASICLVDHRSFSTLEGGMSAASFLHSSFLQAISAVMLWPVHVQKVPQASEHLCPAKLQTRPSERECSPSHHPLYSWRCIQWLLICAYRPYTSWMVRGRTHTAHV